MSNILLWVVGAVVVVGGGYFIVTNMTGESTVPGESTTEEHAGSDLTRGTLASLMTSGQNLECTFSYNDGANVSSGTVYLAARAERIRGDFNITQSAGGAMEVHMIRDGGYNYLWGSAMPQGIKTKITAENQSKLFDDQSGAVDENTEFECQPWSIDESKFAMPSGVQFMDMSAQLEGMMDAGGAMKDMKCAACSQIPEGSARQQCLAALGCN